MVIGREDGRLEELLDGRRGSGLPGSVPPCGQKAPLNTPRE
jgi:hypothetical protein